MLPAQTSKDCTGRRAKKGKIPTPKKAHLNGGKKRSDLFQKNLDLFQTRRREISKRLDFFFKGCFPTKVNQNVQENFHARRYF
jgi:hypothetical protein